MKIIHTSDWHLGQIFNEYDRTPEHAAFFERLTSIIAKEKPDALIVSGDIYHNSTPSSSTQKLYTDAILEMNMLGHTFFMFKDIVTEEINVVYKRKDGKYGLLLPE